MKKHIMLTLAALSLFAACKPAADADDKAAEPTATETQAAASTEAGKPEEAATEEAKSEDAKTEDTAAAASAYATDKEKLGYAFGHQFAKSLVANGLEGEISPDAMAEAIKLALSGGEQKMTDEEMQAAVNTYRDKKQQEQVNAAAENQAKSDAFLEENKGKADVKTTESGLQYKVIKEGKGESPTDESTVEVNYKGSLIDGTVFDSSYDRGQAASFPLKGVIPGFSEGLKLMKEGAKYELYIPSGLAYGENAPPQIGANQALIFEVELISIK